MTKDNDGNIHVGKRKFILSLVLIVSLSVFLIMSGPLLSSTLLPLSPIKLKTVRAQQQPSSTTQQPSSQSSSRPQQPTSQPQQPSSSTSSPSSPSAPTLSSPPGKKGDTCSSDAQCENGQVCRNGKCKDSLPTEICVELLRAILALRGPFDPKGLGDSVGVTCPNNGLSVKIPFPSDIVALGQFCSPELRQKGLNLLQHIQDCQAGTCNECKPCETARPGTITCPLFGGAALCADPTTGVVLQDGECKCSVSGQVINLQGKCECSVPGSQVIGGKCQCPVGTGFLFNACVRCQSNEISQNGVCVACPTAQLACNNQCTDITSPQSCGTSCNDLKTCVPPSGGSATCDSGECKQTCPAGLALENGACVPCPSGTTACDNKCVELSNPDTCGTSCNDIKSCGSGYSCTNGACQPSSNCGPDPFRICSGVCTNINSDNDNCGACGKACHPDAGVTASFCGSGFCQCQAGLILNANNFCVCPDGSTLGTPNNCGTCGNSCGAGFCDTSTNPGGQCICPPGGC